MYQFDHDKPDFGRGQRDEKKKKKSHIVVKTDYIPSL